MYYILDTDHFSLLQRGNQNIVQRIITNPNNIAITIITAEELIRGRFQLIREYSNQKQAHKLASAYDKLSETLDDLKPLNILKYDEQADKIYWQLRSAKISIGTQDLRIAAIVLAHNSILVTRNYRDFQQVPNLLLENWTITN
jgi:tRNA(fMet)-specific endonuclease VapC